MTTLVRDPLLDALIQPASLSRLGPQAWERVIRLGRRSDLLARLAALAQEAGVWDRLEPHPRRHLESAQKLAQRQQRELQFEVAHIAEALAPTGVPVVLLKGAAYAMAGLRAATGRLLSDVDILVPKTALMPVESALMLGGWMPLKQSAYDQRYYRTWMHELPPLRHFRRGTVVDVHHAILPGTARLHPNSDKLLEAARPLRPGSRIHVLAPVDMVLHSATHLMHEGEFERGLRGLVDLDALLGEQGRQPAFWDQLVPRAVELELTRPLFYALRQVVALLQTPVPESVLGALERAPGAHPGDWRLRCMDAAFARALRPAHALAADRWTPWARGFLYLRGHFLRMPPGLLLLHLLRKTFAPTQEGASA